MNIAIRRFMLSKLNFSSVSSCTLNRTSVFCNKVIVQRFTTDEMHMNYRITNIQGFLPNMFLNQMVQKSFYREKHSKRSTSQKDESDDESDSEMDENEKEAMEAKEITLKSLSMRLDDILKVFFYLSRRKVESLLKDDKIRVNGRKILKKNMELKLDDEVDVIQGFDPDNLESLRINRLQIMSIAGGGSAYIVTCNVSRAFTVENYGGENAYEVKED